VGGEGWADAAALRAVAKPTPISQGAGFISFSLWCRIEAGLLDDPPAAVGLPARGADDVLRLSADRLRCLIFPAIIP
jgi:hypothetical protein